MNKVINKSLKLNAFLNVIKQICVIIGPLIIFPYVSKVLGTYYYGKINFGSSIISYISLIAGLGVTKYAIREGSKIRNDREKINKFSSQIFSINFFSTIIAYIILFILIMFWKKLNGYAILLLIQSTSVLFTTIGTDWINSIYEDYLYITIRTIICQIVSIFLILIFVKTPDDYLIYAIANASSIIIANTLNMFFVRKKYDIHPKITLNMEFKTNIKPVLILFGSSIASTIYMSSDVTILGIIYGETIVGIYSISAKIYSLVKQVLNASMEVAIPRISYELRNEKKEYVNKNLSKILGNLLIIVLPVTIGLFMTSKNIIKLIFSNEFISAYSSLEILSFSLIFATLACFFINVVMVPFNMEKKVLITTIVSAITNIILNFALIPKFKENAAAFTTLLSEAIMVIMSCFYTKNIIKLNIKKDLVIGLLGSLITFVVCKIVLQIVSNSLFSIIYCIVGSVILYGFFIFIIDKQKIKMIIKNLKGVN